ncbi:ATP synthase F1 subunit epsilon [Entomobacter blattae]|uniref:ATP synthase epsilon chain n=1 Tax=Entomobacter blattae TaxID=2762277 RepID=A0A7H1NPX4_9PROT|nr:ATP synthase F1 subunit epsilon [Entomobacter blattae]QNT77834.1 ATP synthase epsilon chain, sodium ion specific [Entomobacter blattae]
MAIKVEIVSPLKKILARNADMVVIPGSEGDIAAMPGHSPVLLALRGGVVDVYEKEKIVESYFVEKGFAEITQDACTILTDSAVNVKAIDVAAAEKRLQAAEEAYHNTVDKNDYKILASLFEEMQIASAQKDATTRKLPYS